MGLDSFNEDDFQSSRPSFGDLGSRKRHIQPRLSTSTVCCSSPLLLLSVGLQRQCQRIQYSEQKRWLPDWVIFSTSTEDTEPLFSTGSKVSRRMLLERGLTL